MLLGWGLALSGMIRPEKVVHFLDVTGRFDPTLACVLCAAVAVTAVGYRLIARLSRRPWCVREYDPLRNRPVDAKLVVGAVLFGMGWGLAGLCPGPALADLASGSIRIVLFVAAMVVGMMTAQRIRRPVLQLGSPSPKTRGIQSEESDQRGA